MFRGPGRGFHQVHVCRIYGSMSFMGPYYLWVIANQMRRKYPDVQGEKPVCNDAVKFCLDDRTKQAAWKKTLWVPLIECRVRLGPGLTEVYPMEGLKHFERLPTDLISEVISDVEQTISPLLVITVLEALSQEFRTWCPWENLYADDLVIITESLEEL